MNEQIKYLNVLLLSGILFLMSCHNQLRAQQLSWKTLPPPVVIAKNGAEIFQYWEFKNERFLWDTRVVPPTGLKLYKDSLNSLLGKATFKLTLQKLVLQDSHFKSVKTANGDSINTQLIHSKALGKIRPINFLESQLLGYQLNRYPLLSHPTEFHGFILFNESLNLVRVYFAASDQPWPPKPKVILEAVTNDLKQGWKLKYHLHNHYEPKSNHFLGILAPSMTDAQYYLFLAEDFNLEHALVTNGFHTVDIQSAEFSKLKSPENN
jgi:hypothetical protein